MPDQSAQPSQVEVERSMGNIFATQVLGANDATQDAGPDDTENLAATDGEHVEVEAAEDVPEGDEQVEATDEPDDFFLDLKVDGVEERITDRAEAIKLAQLGKHFTKKNEALIQEKQAFESERKETRDLRGRYAEALPQVEAFLRNPLGDPPKRDAFPDELSYLKADKQYREAQVGVEALRAEMARVQKEQADEQLAELKRWAASEEEATLSAIPEWIDKSVREADAESMRRYLTGTGAPEGVFGNPLLTNAKWFRVVLRDAMRYQQVQSKGATEVKRVQTTTAAPGPKPTGDTASRRKAELLKRAQTGKVDDVAPLMKHLVTRSLELQHNPQRPKR